MDIPAQIASTTIGLAIKFLFDEVHLILQERRERLSSTREGESLLPIKEDSIENNRSAIELIIQKAKIKPTSLAIEKDIKLLLELIEIEKQNRNRAKKQIALQGGFAFASPPTISSLELSESNLIEHGNELKATLESYYGITIENFFS